jgi:prolyl-tRNA editing enzyme YbaK/EbsC (Cys-tRNA(Pro) deacylase)
MEAMEADHPGVARVSAALAAHGHPGTAQWLASSTHTAAQAAEALGVPLGAIAKSVVLRAGEGALLCITAGDRRVNTERLPPHLGSTSRADAACVRRHTGFVIGGVSPLGFAPEAGASAPVVVMDASLWRFATVWAAAGHPRTVFAASPDALLQLTGALRLEFTDD